jgi:hypothetical protein
MKDANILGLPYRTVISFLLIILALIVSYKAASRQVYAAVCQGEQQSAILLNVKSV